MISSLKSLAPGWLKQRIKAGFAGRRAAAFRGSIQKPSLADAAAAVCDARLEFGAGQRCSEITAFLELARTTRPKIAGEIGSASGGNLLLFSFLLPPAGQLISIELLDDAAQRAAYRSLVGPTQHLTCITGDSHDSKMQNRVVSALEGRLFDVLFIDGDHSYHGVKADFEMYAPLVRPGGIVGLHDIVADVFQRYGRPTPSITGGVPTFWRELKQQFPEHWEFIDDPEQDGFGIGALRWPGAI